MKQIIEYVELLSNSNFIPWFLMTNFPEGIDNSKECSLTELIQEKCILDKDWIDNLTNYYDGVFDENDGYIAIAVDTKNKTINITGIEAIKGKGLGVNSYIALQNSDTGGNKAKPNPFKSDRSISNLSTATTMIDDSATRILDAVNRFKSANLSINNAIEQVSPQIKDLKEFKNDIKTTITGTWDKLRDISKTAKESLQNIVKSANQLADKVKSLSFSINDLQDLQKNINMVKDISNIGMLGISNFAVDLNLKDSDKKDNNTSDSANIGTKLIRLSNDNANMIKNIKADLENHVNQLSISKTSLDTTIITPNKRYIVKNYDAHSNNDGVFLLTRKIDYFIKAGDRFTLSTKLDLIKVGESGSVTEKEKQLKDILNNSQNILNTVKSGNLSIGSIGTIMDNAKNIEKSYNKLSK